MIVNLFTHYRSSFTLKAVLVCREQINIVLQFVVWMKEYFYVNLIKCLLNAKNISFVHHNCKRDILTKRKESILDVLPNESHERTSCSIQVGLLQSNWVVRKMSSSALLKIHICGLSVFILQNVNVPYEAENYKTTKHLV